MADHGRPRSPRRRGSNRVRIREGRGVDEERLPLLNRPAFSHEPEAEPIFSCVPNTHSHLPVYTNIHRIRRDIISIVEDYLTLDQLRDVRINVSVVRPLIDKLYDLDDISIVYCLLVNRVQFLHEQSHLNNRQNVNFARATLCELVATRILRRFNEDNPGAEGLLVLAHILVAGFHPFQNAPEEIHREEQLSDDQMNHRTLPALEVAILGESKLFLSSTSCQKVIDSIYTGRIIYTPSTFLNIIPDRYKQKPISLYDPRDASLLNQYRLIVPRTRNILELIQFVVLLCLYLAFMTERDASRVSWIEVCFAVYAFGWVLDNFATILEHGWHVYTQNLWSFLDVAFSLIYWGYLILRIHGLRVGSTEPGQQALDVLAMGAPVLIPRIAFNLLSDNLLFVSLRAMMSDFTLLTALAAWCFGGFLLSLIWLGEGRHNSVTISKWMLWIWFGLDGTGIQRSTDFHWILGPSLMIAFTFLGNTLFLTILVSMLSNTFSTIVSNAIAEIQYRHAVLTLEGVKADAIFAYQPPFNILAMLVLVPLKFLVSPRWFHKIHVASVRALNLPLLLTIALAERRYLWPSEYGPEGHQKHGSSGSGSDTAPGSGGARRQWQWFWENWHITAHGDIQEVFETPPPDCLEDQIAVDDDMTRHLIRRQFIRSNSHQGQKPSAATTAAAAERAADAATAAAPTTATPVAPPTTLSTAASSVSGGGAPAGASSTSSGRRSPKPPGRRDSINPFPTLDLAQQLRDAISESDEVTELTSRLYTLEESMARIETMLVRLCRGAGTGADHYTSHGGGGGSGSGGGSGFESSVSDIQESAALGNTGTLKDLDHTPVGE